MKKILSTSIGSLIANCYFGRPVPAFGEGDAPREDKPDVQLGINDPVSGEELPDFSFIQDDDDTAPAAPVPPVRAAEAKEVTPPPKVEVEPPVPKPGAQTPPIKDPLEEPDIPPVRPQAEEEPVPDPKKLADDAAAEKKAADEAKAAEDAAAIEAAKVAEAAKAAGKEPEVKLPTMEEVDAMQPKAGAPKQVFTDFKKLKEEALKPALREVARLKTELETVSKTAKLTPEQEELIRRADEDRAWREAFELENDPKLKTEFEAKVTKAEDALFKMLQEHPRLGMKKEFADSFRKKGLNTVEGRKDRDSVIAAVKEMEDEFLLDEVKDAFKAVDAVSKEKAAKIEELRGKQGSLVEVKQQREKDERLGWAKACDENIIKLVNAKDEFLLRDVPATATAEEKALLEAHNKSVKETIVPTLQEGLRNVYTRNPEKTMQYLIDSIHLPHVMAERDRLTAQLVEKEARIAELMRDGNAMRRVSAPSQIQNAPPPGKAPEVAATNYNETAEEAADRYARENNIQSGYSPGAR